ncbi:hypothetical protein Hanom_Chr10g00875371 [Helianthus anomalus]
MTNHREHTCYFQKVGTKREKHETTGTIRAINSIILYLFFNSASGLRLGCLEAYASKLVSVLLNLVAANKSKGFSMPKLGAKCVTKCKPQGPSMYFWKKLGTKCVIKCKPKFW